MNRFTALKTFIVASETLNFRETAVRLSISPSVVTRTIAELESELGELLFNRNSRNILLTSFGELFLPKAKRLLEETDLLFASAKQHNEMKGVVRITSLRLPNHEQIVYELLTALRPYPELFIDWRLDLSLLDNVQNRIDIGIRVGREPDPNFIIKPITSVQHIFVASPELIEKLGKPQDLEDLRQRYPFSSLINAETGRAWDFMLDDNHTFTPRHIEFFSTDPYTELQATLTGRTVMQASNLICHEHLEQGRLVNVLPEIQQAKWLLYIYRPYQTITPPRVLKVFEILEGILKKKWAE